MLDDRRPTSDAFGLPARMWATTAARGRDLRRRRELDPSAAELRALAGRIDAERERLTQLGLQAPTVSALARAADCEVETLVLVITSRHAIADRRLDPLSVLLAYARGQDATAIARTYGSTVGSTARVIRRALQRTR